MLDATSPATLGRRIDAPVAKRTRMVLFNSSSPEMPALGKSLRQEGLYTLVRWTYFFTNPPLSITETELREGFNRRPRAGSHRSHYEIRCTLCRRAGIN
jgi:hypothetical protein